jgi:hypothetical protein
VSAKEANPMIVRRGVVKVGIGLALALIAANVVPAIGAVRLNVDVAAQMRYCQTVEDPTTPYFCDADAVRLNVEERPNTW